MRVLIGSYYSKCKMKKDPKVGEALGSILSQNLTLHSFPKFSWCITMLLLLLILMIIKILKTTSDLLARCSNL